MADVFAEKEAVVFVRGTLSNAGGCTRYWWDTEVPNGTEAEALAAMLKLMDVAGDPYIDDTGLTYTDGTTRVDAAVPGDFATAEAGMVAYIAGTNITAGMYEITTADPDYLIFDDIVATGDNVDTEIVVGGSFGTLQEALDESSAVDYSCWIYTSRSETLAAAIDIDINGGDTDKNTFKRIIGFSDSPGDMDFGGTYYQSPFEILIAGSIDNTKALLLDAAGGAFSVLNIGSHNIVIENIHCYDTTAPAIVTTGTPKNTVLRNCKVSACQRMATLVADRVLFDSCYAHGDLTAHYLITSGGLHTYLNCLFNMAAGKNVMNATAHRVDVDGCLITGAGQYGIHLFGAGAFAHVINNTFYGLTTYGVFVSGGDNAIVANNIFVLAPGAVALQIGATGSISYNDYNCFIETDGTPLTVGGHTGGHTAPVIGEHSIAVDPMFRDAGANDFRLRSGSPCRRIGRPTIGAT